MADPCALWDYDRITAMLGPDGGSFAPPRTHTGEHGTWLLCEREYGVPGGDLTAFVVRLDLAEPDTIRAQFDALRRARDRSAPAVTVDGLGAGAYVRTDRQLGQQLSVYGGNLNIEITVTPITGQALPAAQVRPIMIQTAREVMGELLMPR
ncbi:hypothetical protein [Actinoplanes sp. HUAS TT8]|uniref:hypothetical protein n=1 Tax=Actinoplanes sp. HUAS TT8 TaxID=3447453 RepID=UPI003F5283DA